jgi:hypothetical protein
MYCTTSCCPQGPPEAEIVPVDPLEELVFPSLHAVVIIASSEPAPAIEPKPTATRRALTETHARMVAIHSA